MKKPILMFAAVGLLFTTACNQAEKKAEAETNEEAVEANDEVVTEESNQETDSVHFGQMIDAEGALTIDEFATEMKGKDSLNVKIAAIAADVCQKKGCWMKVQLADGNEMRIRFKDYGFFVPKDISGKNVVFDGIAFKEEVSVEDLKHFAEDEGKSAEEIAAITEPEVKTSFVATGVLIK
jgi:flagellar biosynthesis component FlhA